MNARRALKWITLALERAIGGAALLPATPAERGHITDLRTALARCPEAGTANVPASEAAWLGFARRMRTLALTADPRRFLRWEVVGETMFAESADYAAIELGHLRHLADWWARWEPAIKESHVGAPPRYLRQPATSRNLVHQAFHVATFEQATGMQVDKYGCVVEFGGGYGGMCRLIHNLGFRGTYVIFDLPVFSAIQLYYLRSAGLGAESNYAGGDNRGGRYCISDLGELARLLECVPQSALRLFLATWSLSEVELGLRRQVRELVADFDAFLIAYQDGFGEVDNEAAFKEWRASLPGHRWDSLPIRHIPGNHYLFGARVSQQPDRATENLPATPRAIPENA